MTDRYLVPGLVRGIEALQAFTPERQQMSLGELASAVGVTRSAVYRIAYTLCQYGLLVHDHAGKTYSLGPSVLRLGYGYRAAREIVEVAMPHLERLRDEIGWSAHLGVLEGTNVVYMMRVPTRRGLASIVRVGSRLPAHATSMGRVLLASLSEAEVRARYADAAFVGLGAKTPTTLADLVRQWQRDRTRRYIDQIGEFERKVASVAAPVRDVSGRVVAAVNLAAAIKSQNPTIPEQTRRCLVAAAVAISRELGHSE